MAGLVPAIHVLHYPHMLGGYVYIMASAPNGILYVGVTNDLVRRVYEHHPGIYEKVFRQAPSLLRALRGHSDGDPTRTQYEALVAKMESTLDTGQQSGMERFVRFDRLDSVMPGLVPGIHVLVASEQGRTWMAGTSPAMTLRVRYHPKYRSSIPR